MDPLKRLSIAPLAVVKSTIAQLILESSDDSLTIGQIRLKPHQASAVARLRQSIREFGGGILCDPVGTGKTFTALALPACDDKVAVVAPAVLRQMWLQALSMSDRKADFISFESLSRGYLPSSEFDFVIVDEAHHARNAKTARFAMLSRLVARADVVLLTATPIHNRRQDLISLLSLFLGERAVSLTKAEMARCVIRRDGLSKSIPGMPSVDSVEWIHVRDDPRIPELLLSLPPPVPLRDGGDGGVLIARSLIRQWASSNASLIGGLKRRLARAMSLTAALADGTLPTRTELMSWVTGEDAVQLGLPGLLASPESGSQEMLVVVQRHAEALRAVLAIAGDSRADEDRCRLIRRIRGTHADRRIIAFSQYADTVAGFYAPLSRDGNVGALTGTAGRVAGGTIARFDALAGFAPIAMGCRRAKSSDDIRLLLATDLVSEGVNLQDAGVVIHLDLPWTAARMEQRLGRVARIGSRHERVQSYAFLPPASANDVVRIERILRTKIEAAGLIEGSFPSLAGWLDDALIDTPDPEITEEIRDVLRSWLSPACRDSCVASIVSASVNGFLAVAVHGALTRTIVQIGDQIGESPRLSRDCLSHCGGAELEPDLELVAKAEEVASAWLAADDAMSTARLPSGSRSGVRAGLGRRLLQAVRNAPQHHRAVIAARTELALEILQRHMGVYNEKELSRLSATIPDDETLLDRIAETRRGSASFPISKPEVIAMIVLTRR